jgi:hypothetical protein
VGRSTGWLASAAALAVFAPSGCIVIPKPKPFTQPVAARQLAEVGAAPVMETLPAVELVPLASAPVAIPVSTPEATTAPERTEIKGAGDGSMKLDRVVVTANDVPHRAPDFSSEQAAAMLCAATKAGFGGNSARRMHEATVKAEQARRDYDARKISLKEMNRLELKRQDAVRGYMMPVPLLGMLISGAEKKSEMPPPVFRSVAIEETDLFTFQENGKEVIAVSGVARNRGSQRVEMPPLTLRAIDQWDFSVAGQSSLLPLESLGPGEARPFEIRFLNPPANTAEVYVHFAPPFMYRARRDCDFFDPKSFDPEAMVAETEESVPVRRGAETPYSASELNLLTLFYRRESEAAWRCQNLADSCGAGAQRLHWRDMYVMAEAIDEAWIALRAAEEAQRRLAEGKGTRAEAEAADLARQKAIGRFTDLGETALTRAGASAKGVDVAVTASTYGRDEEGLFIEVAGTVRNSSERPRKVDSLMVAFVDRRELPLSSIAIDAGLMLAPGETKEFSHLLRAAAGRTGDQIVIGVGPAQPSVALARIPPRNIPWEVRVGAMSRE